MSIDKERRVLEKGRYAGATMDCAFKAVMQDDEVRLALISDFLGRNDIVSTEPYVSAVPSIRRPGRTQKYRDGSQRKLGSRLYNNTKYNA